MRVPSTPILAIGCAVLATMVLAPSIFGEWVWDDHQLIELNPHVSDFDVWYLLTHHFWDVPLAPPTSTLYYRPIAGLGHALAWRIGGGDALYFHLLNLLLHAACTALTMTWLVRRIPGADTALGRGAVAVATLAFALHPARVQSVAWASGSTDLWATLFVLIGAVVAAKRTTASSVIAGLAFAAGVLSKEVAVVAPALVIADAFLVEERRPGRRELAALVGPVVAALALRTALIGVHTGSAPTKLANLPGRVTFTLGRYVVDAVFPASPTVQINAPFDQLWTNEPLALAATILGAVIAAALLGSVALVRKPRARPWLADLAWVVLPLLPVLNILSIGQGVTVASRLLYFPLLGATAATARILVGLFQGRFRIPGLVVAGGLIVFCALFSTEELAHWQDDVSLARHWRQQRPHDPTVADNLARVLLRKGQLVEAYRILSDRIDTHGTAQSGVYAQITWAYVRLVLTSDHDQAQLRLLKELFDDIASGRDPDITLPERRLAPRLTDFARAEIMQNPTYGDFHDARGWSHARTGDLVAARRIFDVAPSVTRDTAHGCDRRIRVRAFATDWDDALSLLHRCQERYPDSAWPQIASALERGRELWASPSADPIEAAVARSRLMSDLGLPALGRSILEPLRGVADTRVVHARVQADISDERYDLALAELDAAIAAMPDARAELEAARVEVRRHASTASGRRSPPIWER